MPEFAWIPEERVYGSIVHYGAYVSRIIYEKGGITFDVYLSNDEFEIFGDHDYESE